MKPPTWPLYRLTETEDVNGYEGETWREIAVRAETMHGRRYIFQVAKFCPDNMTADEVEAQLDFARGAVVEAVTNAIVRPPSEEYSLTAWQIIRALSDGGRIDPAATEVTTEITRRLAR